jgi:hypothetical protein
MIRSLPSRSALLLLSVLPLGCTDLTAPASFKPGSANAPSAPAQPASVKPAAVKPTAIKPSDPAPGADSEDVIEASHVLIAYQGARRSQATRTKQEAQQLAEKVLKEAKAGKSFAELTKEFSDDKKGAPLRLTPKRMGGPLAKALTALKPGEISGVVESPFGFHVILRSP